MKKRSILLFAGIVIPMLFLQLSCATQEKAQPQTGATVAPEAAKPAPETQAKPVEAAPSKAPEAAPAKAPEAAPAQAPAAAQFLADKHKAAGVSCSDCHKETPPASEAPSSICLNCHADYKDKASSAIDPHNAHMSYTNCGDCHHAHKASENQCQSCHSFNLQTP
jgi:hypothetical protein